jgi:hypothetical protein
MATSGEFRWPLTLRLGDLRSLGGKLFLRLLRHSTARRQRDGHCGADGNSSDLPHHRRTSLRTDGLCVKVGRTRGAPIELSFRHRAPPHRRRLRPEAAPGANSRKPPRDGHVPRSPGIQAAPLLLGLVVVRLRVLRRGTVAAAVVVSPSCRAFRVQRSERPARDPADPVGAAGDGVRVGLSGDIHRERSHDSRRRLATHRLAWARVRETGHGTVWSPLPSGDSDSAAGGRSAVIAAAQMHGMQH